MLKCIDFVVQHARAVLITIIIISLPLAFYYTKQSYLSNIEVYFNKSDPAIEYYKGFQKTFGNEEIVSIVFSVPDVYSVRSLTVIRSVTKAVSELSGVKGVISITNTEFIRGQENLIDFEKLVPDGEITESDSTYVSEKVHHYRSVFNNLVSKDASTAAVLVEFCPLESPLKRSELIGKMKIAAERAAAGKVSLHYSGTPLIDNEINRLTLIDNLKFTPLAFLIVFIITLILFKNIYISVLCQANILLVVLWSSALLVLNGESLNSVTVIIPPLLLAIATADSIHIISFYKKCRIRDGMEHLSAVRKTMHRLWKPCLFTSLTTATGYFSFIFTSVRPVKIAGIYTGIGLIIAFLLSMTFFPAALALMKNIVRVEEINNSPKTIPVMPEKLAEYVSRNYIKIITCFIVITIISGAGIVRIKYDTDFAGYLKENNQVKKDLQFVEDRLRGTIPVEVVITALSNDNDFTHPNSLKLLEKVQKMMVGHMKKSCSSSFSAADYIKTSHMAFNGGQESFNLIPEKRGDIIDYQELCDDRQLAKYLSIDRMEARISLITYFASTESYKEFERFLETRIKDLLEEKYEYRFTGVAALYTKMDSNLKSSQINSFSFALVLIFIMMVVVCKNFWLALISMIPNFFPVFVTLGIMGWGEIPLDVSTIMIASITIGIAVDDTIHFLTWFRRNADNGMDIKKALVKTYSDTGRPVIFTSLILCSVYFLLMTGSVKPIVAFGEFAGLAIFLALIGDLIILPAFLLINPLTKRFIKEKVV